MPGTRSDLSRYFSFDIQIDNDPREEEDVRQRIESIAQGTFTDVEERSRNLTKEAERLQEEIVIEWGFAQVLIMFTKFSLVK